LAAAGYQPRQDLLSAAGKPLRYSARLDGRFHLDMDNPPGLANLRYSALIGGWRAGELLVAVIWGFALRRVG
jgi:hypothetical protein